MSEGNGKTLDRALMRLWIVRALWVLLLGGILFSIILFTSLASGDLPSFEDLENPQYDLATIIYDGNNVPFGKYYVENREAINFDSLNQHVFNALIATEDVRYFSHSGVDPRALFRVAFKSVLLQQGDSGGGSTISQQLSKLLFDRPNLKGNFIKKTVTLIGVKLKEWITAVKLERQYTKEEIIAMYLNKFEFINGAHGIQAAAQTYFGKNQEALKPEEAAVLVGMLKNPSLYNPTRFPEKSLNRRNTVLAQMYKADYIDKQTRDSLSTIPIDMSGFKRSTFSEGPAPYFRAELTKWLKDLFDSGDILKEDGSKYNIYTDGLRIYTTIDLQYQKHAEAAVIEHMKWNQERYFKVWKNKDPWTYEADSIQKIIRADVLSSKIKASDRYLSLRSRYLDDLTEKFRTRYKDLPLSDNVIKTLIDIHQGKTTVSQAVTKKALDSNYANAYGEILKMQGFRDLMKQWDDLQQAFDKDFNTPVMMKVFDYGEGFEKEVEMTPLDSVRYHNQHLQAGLLAVNPQTGYIKAWVGGVNHKYFKYDHVNSRRQVGSTMKPFVYTTAIAVQGISPCQSYDDIQYTIVPGDANFDLADEWSPANANGEFTGNKYNLYHGLLYSKNSITVRLIKEMGSVQVLRDLLRNVGIKVDQEVLGEPVVPNLPSICLGAVHLPLIEMTGAYTAFANNGIYTEPIFVTRIEDKNGKVLYNGIPDKKVAINPLYNAVMVDMLKNNVGGKYGLGIKSEVGGKTGTTNDYADGWFISITPNLVTGAWVGGDDNWIRFLTLDDGQGYVMARPAVSKFLRRVEGDSLINFNTKARFREPPAAFYDLVNCDKFKQITPEEEQNQIRDRKSKNDAFDENFDDEFGEEFDGEF